MTEPITPDQIFVRKLTDIVLANLEDENFGVKELALESGFSNRSLSRKLLKINKHSVSQFIRNVRLRKAVEMLQEGTYTVSEIGYKVGFNSPVYFTKCFHEQYGYPPVRVKKGDLNDLESRKLADDTVEHKSTGHFRERLVNYWPGILIFIVLLGTSGYFIYSKFHRSDWTDDLVSPDGSISIAVMPFQNMTRDTTWNIWQDGIQSRFISNLVNNPSLKVRPQDITNTLLQVSGQANFAFLSPSVIRNISRKLDASLYIKGSIREANSVTSIDAQLLSTRTNEVIESFKLEGYLEEKDAFRLADTLSQRLMNFLLISKLANEHHLFNARSLDVRSLLPGSAEEYRYCYYGNKALFKGDNELAISWYLKALAIDSNDFGPMIGLSSAYSGIGRQDENLKWVLKYYKMKGRWPLAQQLYASWAYAFNFEPPEEGIRYLKQLQDLMGTHSMGYLLGYSYCKIKQYEKAIPEFEGDLQMSRKFGKEFMENNWSFDHLTEAYNKTGQYRKERKLIREWEKYNSENISILHQKASLSLSVKDFARAEKYMERFKLVYKKNGSPSEADITEGIGRIYYDTDMMDEAESYYQKALALDPDDPERLYRIASFFTETERSLDDVPSLMDRAMEHAKNKVDYCNYMSEKGWGLYKQGRYNEALAVSEKAWNEAPFKLYSLRSHYEEVKKAASVQK